MPNKRVYSISIFWFFPETYSFIWPYSFSFSTLLNKQILHSTRLFGPLVLLFNEIYLKYPSYSFIWPYSFNWHLRVGIQNVKKCIGDWWQFWRGPSLMQTSHKGHSLYVQLFPLITWNPNCKVENILKGKLDSIPSPWFSKNSNYVRESLLEV